MALEDAEQDRDNLRYQLSERKRENDKLSERLSCLSPNYDTSKKDLEGVITQRDKLRKQVESLTRDLRTTKEKNATVNITTTSGRDSQSEKSTSRAEMTELKAEISRLKKDGGDVVKERDRLAKENGELRSKLDHVEGRVRSLEMECRRYSITTTES